MPYSEVLADRIRDALVGREKVEERKMFGGIAFMLGDHMAVGVVGEDLMVRLAPEDAQSACAEPHVRPMDFTGRPMKSMVLVEPEGIAADSDLAAWVDAAADHVSTLPSKPKK